MSDIERARAWMDGVGGAILTGESEFKSVKKSKGGDRLTIVLKRKKQKKAEKSAEES